MFVGALLAAAGIWGRVIQNSLQLTKPPLAPAAGAEQFLHYLYGLQRT